MANEISFNYSLDITNGSFVHTSRRSLQINQTNKGGGVPGHISAATGGGTAISFSALTNPGVAEITNLDTTNFVDIGHQRFLPGETWVFRVKPGTTMTAVADTAACRMRVCIYEA